MELRTYLAIAARYRWQLLVIPLIAALVALAATYVISPRFVGVAVVQLIPEEVEPRTVSLRDSTGASTIALGLRDPTELLAQSVIESVQSAEVARYVSDDLAIASLPPPTGWNAVKAQARQLLDDAWALVRFGYVARRPHDEAVVERVGKALGAELVRGSYFMEVFATWRDPETAAELANAAVDGIIVQTRAVAHASAAEQRQFLEQERAAARTRVDAARTALIQYSSRNGLVEGASLRAALSSLEQARAALRQNALSLADAQRRLAVTRQQLQSLSPDVLTTTSTEGASQPIPSSTSRSSVPSLTYQTLESRVALLVQDVAALEARGSQGSAEVIAQLETQIADARQRLETARQQLQQSGLDDTVRNQLQTQAFAIEQEITGLTARRDEAVAAQNAQTDRELVETRSRLEVARQQLAGISPTIESVSVTTSAPVSSASEQTVSSPNPIYQSVQRDVLSYEQQVQALEDQQTPLEAAVQTREHELKQLTAVDGQLQAFSQDLQLASEAYTNRTQEWYNALMNESRPIAPIRLIDAAVMPLYPAYPIKLYWALIGAAAGMATALILVFIHYNTDPSLRLPSEAELALDLPLLMVVPSSRKGVRRGGVQ